jgi:hypothetical protein
MAVPQRMRLCMALSRAGAARRLLLAAYRKYST